jgi:predicted  nucleic acid-binding Zn-ribbon protein
MTLRRENIEQRIATQGEHVERQIAEQGAQLRQCIEAQGAQLTKLVEQGAQHDSRITSLDERLTRVEQDLTVIKSNYATQADVLAAKNSIIMWVVSAIFLAQLLPMLAKQLGG